MVMATMMTVMNVVAMMKVVIMRAGMTMLRPPPPLVGIKSQLVQKINFEDTPYRSGIELRELLVLHLVALW